ncbi:MAG: SDR family NAD(P)-dependent oxidoreductase [Taibaiella sp.]|nr:SDR family NAD(P)-dependent oxidoreductase [Taibaiella sp.]
MNTSNNTIFISGGSAGIGFEIAKLFSAKRNKIIINGRNKERLENALTRLKNATAIQGDLSVESERIRIAAALKQQHPDVNVIVNNAGAAYVYSLADAEKTYEYAVQEINTNYVSIIHFTELLLPHLRIKENAAIANVTSIAGLIPSTGLPTYSASKAALHFYTQSLRSSLAETNINVFEVMPPLVNTDFSAEIGGANGIPPKEVAEELFIAFESNRFDVPVGQTKAVYAVLQEATSKPGQ